MITNSEINSYLKDTSTLEKTTSPSVGDAAVYRDQNGDVIHSARVTSVGDNGDVSVTMAAGVAVYDGSRVTTVPAENGFTGAKSFEYWTRNQK